MTAQVRVPFRRRQLGRTLRRLREQARLTQEEAGARLRYSDSKICRVEAGQLPDYHGLRAMLDLYGLIVNDWQPVLDLWELASKPGWWQAYGLDDQGYVSMEDEAEAVREFQPGFVPGLLQTEAYARLVFEASGMPRSKKATENQIAVRMRRQDRLTGDPALRFDAVIDEAVLRQRIEPGILRPQLRQIVERAELPNVSVRVVPHQAGLHDGHYGTFTVLSFPDKEDHDIGYVEHAFGAVHIEDDDEVATARLRFGYLADLALDPDDSAALLRRIVEEL